VQRRRLEREGERPVPHYREHVPYVSSYVADWVSDAFAATS
jgi:hypothetical protein